MGNNNQTTLLVCHIAANQMYIALNMPLHATHTIFFAISSSRHQMCYTTAEVFPNTAAHPMNQQSHTWLNTIKYSSSLIKIHSL